jgi:hypothetical protein
MKKEVFMRAIILAGAAVLTLSACGGGGSEANDANAMGTANTMAIDPMMDPNMTMDANAMNGAGMTGTNGAMDANTQNMMQRDATTNDPDTNLANGL